ncbi:MAG: AbiV family abortive infection protein [Pseudonocardiaceae bacterium]
MATSQPLPGSRELEALAHAAFTNSQRLLTNAELLLDNGSWPVAHALATLALEEVGKSFLCIFASANPEPFREDFWTAFRSHTVKIQMAHVVLAPLADTTRPRPFFQAIEAFGQAAKADHSTKMRGLYADYQDGTVLNPGDVTEQDARGMVVHARDGLDLLTPFTTDDGLDPEFTTFLAAQSAHLMTLFTSPDGDRDALVQQLWDTILAGEAEPPSWVLSNMLPDPGDDGSHNNIPKWDNS